MQALYLWPDSPLLSLSCCGSASVVFLWAAREPMARLLAGLGSFVGDGCQGLAQWCRDAAQELRKRAARRCWRPRASRPRASSSASSRRWTSSFAEKLGELLEAAPPARRAAARARGGLQEVRRGAAAGARLVGGGRDASPRSRRPATRTSRRSSRASASRRATPRRRRSPLYRDDTARRHKTLGGMVPTWKDVRGLMSRMCDAVAKALESTQRIKGYADEFEKFRRDQEGAARALTWSATKFFTVSLIVLGVALGGAFVNFQLIALPMSELVPAGARVGGVPVATGVGAGDRADGDGARHLHHGHARHHRPAAAPARDPVGAAPADPRPGTRRAVLPGLRRELAGGAARAAGRGRRGARSWRWPARRAAW